VTTVGTNSQQRQYSKTDYKTFCTQEMKVITAHIKRFSLTQGPSSANSMAPNTSLVHNTGRFFIRQNCSRHDEHSCCAATVSAACCGQHHGRANYTAAATANGNLCSSIYLLIH
jgi:hypothetical protein